MSGEGLQIVLKRRQTKSKGEKERYKHLNAEFQRKARRDKKAFFRDQCKEMEEKSSSKLIGSGGGFITKLCLTVVTPWTVAC